MLVFFARRRMSSLPTRLQTRTPKRKIPVAALIGPSHLPNEMRSKSIASDGYMSRWTAANKTTKKPPNATHSVWFHLLATGRFPSRYPRPGDARIPTQYPRAWCRFCPSACTRKIPKETTTQEATAIKAEPIVCRSASSSSTDELLIDFFRLLPL